ncbi:CD166 antigen homolog isoform X2 [Nelusetta ayraudi]|uniref:CD166 antigen homolog isoform X2 n=1 Tax=Nelusetta ayraudi TaxID=303726 RepID=UPI003F7227F3
MVSAAFLLLALTSAGTLLQVCASGTLIASYGETITIPCNNGAPPPQDLIFIKWKYEKDDGTPGDLLIKQASAEKATIHAIDGYAQRISVDDNYNLLIAQASLKDIKTFTCMVVFGANLMEYPVSVVVQKKPSSVEVADVAQALQKDKPVTLGTCVAADAYPKALLSWKKNGSPLESDGKAVVISNSTRIDPPTGLSTTSSTLQYTATKDDMGVVFTCVSTQGDTSEERELEPFPVLYEPEKISLQILSKGPVIEGNNVTLKCHADGNPQPNTFYFHLKGQKVLVEGMDTYTLNAISREESGEYKCSLADNEYMEASQNIAVSYLDLHLGSTGKVVKAVGEGFSLKTNIDASGDHKVSWTKDGKTVKPPLFGELTFGDAGVYMCEVSMAGLTRHQSFELVVEGKPVITQLTKRRSDDGQHKELTCEADAVPEPTFQWSVNSTDDKGTYKNGKAVHTIHVVPRLNLTVTCTVTNKFGEDVRSINVSSGSQDDPEDQSSLIVAIVIGLLLVAGIVGLGYWCYMKNSRQGSWKTGEKEVGTSEESKKLEENRENNHPV